MAHFAKIDENNIVVEVLVTDNNEPDEGYAFLVERLGGNWLKTSRNTRNGVHYDPETGEPSDDQSKALRFNYAGIGYFYDAELDGFIPQKMFDSWVLDKTTCNWVAPVAYPNDGNPYEWNEGTQSWDPVSEA